MSKEIMLPLDTRQFTFEGGNFFVSSLPVTIKRRHSIIIELARPSSQHARIDAEVPGHL
ncbi:MAG: hypothetical protein RLO04_00530 [Limnobacter sp.]